MSLDLVDMGRGKKTWVWNSIEPPKCERCEKELQHSIFCWYYGNGRFTCKQCGDMARFRVFNPVLDAYEVINVQINLLMKKMDVNYEKI